MPDPKKETVRGYPVNEWKGYPENSWKEEKFPKAELTLRNYLDMSPAELEEAKELINEAILFKKMGS